MSDIIQKKEIRALTGLRGIAALGVVLGHYQALGSLNSWFVWHNVAVDLFFILSGFTLSYVYLPGKNYSLKKYFYARIARILPLSILSTVVMGFVFVLPNLSHYSLNTTLFYIDLFRQSIGINAWPLVGDGKHWNIPAWSISVEMFIYLWLFPIFLFSKLSSNIKVIFGVLLLFPVASTLVYLHYFDWLYISDTQPGNFSLINKLAPIIRGVLDFIVGCFIFKSYEDQNILWQFFKNKSIQVTTLIFFILYLSTKDLVNNHYLLPLFPFLVLSLLEEKGAIQKFLSSPILYSVGLWSYSIYIWQLPIKLTLLRVFALEPINKVFSESTENLITLLVLMIFSSFSYRYFEKPLRGLIRAGSSSV